MNKKTATAVFFCAILFCDMERYEMKKYSNQYEKMTKSPVPVLILSLGLPTTISMLVTSIYNVADTYFVGKLGTSASGATGIVFALMAVLQAFGFMFGHGAGSIISRRLGARDIEDACKFASTSFFCAIAAGILIMVSGILFLNPFMRLLGSTETILPYARIYGFYILLAAPAMTSSCVMNNILRYEGRAFFAMIGLTSGGILNIILDAVLIYGFQMGIAGAGIATAFSQYVSAFILLTMFLRGKTESRLSIRYFTKSWRDILEIIRVGFPSMVRQGMGSISTMVLNQQAGVYGDAAIAAMSIVSRVCNFIFCVGLGIGQGFQPVAGFNYGAKKYSRVRKGFYFTSSFGTVLLGILAVIVMLNAQPIVRFFRDDPAVTEIGTLALKIQCISLFFLPFAVSGNMMFQSIGKSETATFLSSLRGGLFYIPLLLILPVFLGLLGIQISQTVADIMAGVVTIPFAISFFRKLPADTLDKEKRSL